MIIPGSMGASSYALAGSGEAAAMESACHGAGRAMTRIQARAADGKDAAASLETLRVVTPIDPDAPTVRRRREPS